MLRIVQAGQKQEAYIRYLGNKQCLNIDGSLATVDVMKAFDFIHDPFFKLGLEIFGFKDTHREKPS